ncbi:MAG TPA: Spy/CpxP family protein refolding chaperone [Nitrospiraceae bacterium]|nr:Spy/CpxP family protein refolding chaperone [Nitrospiraceae bacterium]
MKRVMLMGIAVTLLMLGGQPLWADEPQGGPKEQGKGYGGQGEGMKGRHGGAGHFLRHLLMHQKEIGLSEEQVGKIKTLQLELDKTRIRTEADIQVANRELHALIQDDKADLASIEAKLRQGANLEVGLRLAAVKARRDAMALLTPEQREKEKAEHEKMMQMHGEHRMGERKGMEHGMGQGMKPGAERMEPAH